MKRIAAGIMACILCLLMWLTGAGAEAAEHPLTLDMNDGACRTLTGSVRMAVLFVDTPSAQWTAEERTAFTRQIRLAAAALEADAASYGVSLTLRLDSYTAQAEADFVTDQASLWTSQVLKDNRLLQDGCDGKPVLFCLPGEGRCFAQTALGEEMEYVLLYGDTAPGAIRHELLHLYGANDFYLHPEVKEAAQNRFPDSIMLDTADSAAVDSFTAYCIGWTQEPDARALLFLMDTDHLTPAQLNEALAASMRTGFYTVESDQGVYTGMLAEGRFHGTGEFRWHNGNVYTGQWADGKQHGQGCYVWTSGVSYTGGFDRGERHGQGVMLWTDGSSYTGGIDHGVYSGKGVMVWPDGSSYTGDFADNRMSGTGVMRWPDGSCYSGGFLDGVQHGQGVFTAADGSVITGVWQHGALTK